LKILNNLNIIIFNPKYFSACIQTGPGVGVCDEKIVNKFKFQQN